MFNRPSESADSNLMSLGKDSLLLRELTHRTANEVASALAAMRLAASAGRGHARWDLVDGAIGRLEAFGEVNRFLARPVGARVDASAEVTSACRAYVAGRLEAAGGRVEVDAPEAWVDGATGRRLALVAVELVGNALRHGLAGRAGTVTVRLRRTEGELRLDVRDDGPGIRPGAATSRTGLGRGIVSELVERGGGSIRVRTGARGTAVRVRLPDPAASDPEDDYAF